MPHSLSFTNDQTTCFSTLAIAQAALAAFNDQCGRGFTSSKRVIRRSSSNPRTNYSFYWEKLANAWNRSSLQTYTLKYLNTPFYTACSLLHKLPG